MKIAHARERHAPAGAPFRLHAAADEAGTRWIDLEVARRRAIRADERLAHNAILFRQPVTTLDDHLARGLRVEALAEIVERFGAADEADDEDDDAIADATDLAFGSPDPAPGQPARLLRLRAARRDDVATARHARAGGVVPAAHLLLHERVRDSRARRSRSGRPTASHELDYELEIAALIDTPAKNLSAERGEEAIGGYFVMNDWSARDLQRDETAVRLGPAKGKDFATTLGPWLVTPDEIASARSGNGYDLAATVTINGRVALARQLARHPLQLRRDGRARLCRRPLRAGDVLGSGTVGGCCLLEVKDESGFGRYLEPGDRVTLKVDRLGELSSPVVARPRSEI